MSRADNGVEDVDDEFTKQAKDAANAASAREDASEKSDDAKTPEAAEGTTAKKTADKPAKDKRTKPAKDKPGKDATGKKAKSDADEDAEKPSKRSRREPKPQKVATGLNPAWWVPTMLGLMVLGLIWLVVFYLSSAKFPIPGIGTWNLAIGFVLLMAGFAMTTRWK